MGFTDIASSNLSNFSKSLLSIIKVLISSKFSSLKKINLNKKTIIIANGPSINEIFENTALLEEIKNIDTFCVNYFYKSEYFKQIKPKYYAIAGPELWEDNVEDKYLIERLEFYKSIANEVNWEMSFFIPYQAKKKSFWQEIISKNKNITIEYYNITAIEGFSKVSHFLYEKKLGMPRSHNIAGYSLMLSIWKNYKSIGLIGVEHSWTKSLFVTENNEALLSQPHFYNPEASAKKMSKRGRDRRKLHEILTKFLFAFKSYFEILEYANKKNVKIYNLTKNSFIDAFERKDINEFLSKI